MECSKSDIACRNACAKHDDITKSVKAEVDNAFGEPDTSDLKRSFRWALSSSTPPLALYRNYPPVGNSNSNLIFGVPLVDHCVNEDEVPKVMDICIKEVEKRGLNIDNIYLVSLLSHVFGKSMLTVLVGFYI